MKTTKSFVGLESAYAFFKNRSNQLTQAIEAIGSIAQDEAFPRQEIRMCFLGCSDIEVALHLVETLKKKHIFDVTLVDTHSN